MSFNADQGETLLVPTSPSRNHLFVVVTERDPGGRVLIINFETRKRITDDTVIIKAGEHPFVTHETSVRYKSARIVDADLLINKVKTGIVESREPCSPELLEKIRLGIMKSPHTSNEVRDFYDDIIWGNI